MIVVDYAVILSPDCAKQNIFNLWNDTEVPWHGCKALFISNGCATRLDGTKWELWPLIQHTQLCYTFCLNYVFRKPSVYTIAINSFAVTWITIACFREKCVHLSRLGIAEFETRTLIIQKILLACRRTTPLLVLCANIMIIYLYGPRSSSATWICQLWWQFCIDGNWNWRRYVLWMAFWTQ